MADNGRFSEFSRLLPVLCSKRHVISALRAKRAEVAGLIDSLEKLLAQHRADLMHLDGVLRLYQPDTDPTAILPKQIRGRNRYFGQGELSRLCREAFRDADGPLTVAGLTAAVIAAKGFDAGDRVLRDRIDDLVKVVLGPMRRAGSV